MTPEHIDIVHLPRTPDCRASAHRHSPEAARKPAAQRKPCQERISARHPPQRCESHRKTTRRLAPPGDIHSRAHRTERWTARGERRNPASLRKTQKTGMRKPRSQRNPRSRRGQGNRRNRLVRMPSKRNLTDRPHELDAHRSRSPPKQLPCTGKQRAGRKPLCASAALWHLLPRLPFARQHARHSLAAYRHAVLSHIPSSSNPADSTYFVFFHSL